MSTVTDSPRWRANSTSEQPRRQASSLSNVAKTSRSSCSASSASRADVSSFMAAVLSVVRSMPAAYVVALDAPRLRAGTPVAVLGDDELGQLVQRAFRRRLVERDGAVLQEVDPVADIEHLGVVVHDEDHRDAALG